MQWWAEFSSVFHQDHNDFLFVMRLNFEISGLTTKYLLIYYQLMAINGFDLDICHGILDAVYSLGLTK